MSATDRIREQFQLWDSVDDRGQVLVAREDAEALCDLADAARAHLARKAVHDPYDGSIADALARLDGEDGP